MSGSGNVRERSLALGLVMLGGAIALLASVPTWVSATVRDAGLPVIASQVNGRSVAPLVAAAGLLALAGGFAALIAGAWARRVIGALVVLIGSVALWSVVGVLRDPAAVVAGALGDAVGLTEVTVATAALSIWPTVALLACTLMVVGGAWTLARAGSWSGGGRRFDRQGPAAAVAESKDDKSNAESDGNSQGESDGESDGEDTGSARVQGSTDESAAGLWDAIDRGEDPTL